MSLSFLKSGFAVIAGAGLFLLAGQANAASQGSLGSTSTGTAVISVTKSMQAQISGISDMTLPSWSVGQGEVKLTSNVCIYSSTGGYRVTATGSGSASAFSITSGSNDLAYGVVWNDGGAGSLLDTGTSLTKSVQSSRFTHASTLSANCNGGGAGNATARVVVTITEADMIAAAASTTPYTGTLTMIVAPD